MNLVLVVLSFLTALLPLADRGMQQYRQLKQAQPAQVVQTVMKPVNQPPEAGQPHVVFHNGEWWKYEGGQWLVWRQNVQIARGGAHVVR